MAASLQNDRSHNNSHQLQPLSQLPILAISPPSRPETPQLHGFTPSSSSPSSSSSPLKDYTVTRDHPEIHGNTNSTYNRPQTSPPIANTPTKTHDQRPRSYSIKNGLLSPDLPLVSPASSSSFSSSSSSSSSSPSLPRIIPTDASSTSSPESSWNNWGSSPVESVVSSYTDLGATWCDSPTDPSFDHKNPFASPSSSALSLVSSLSPANEPIDHEKGTACEGGPGKTVYHIYHSGALAQSFSIHLESDSLSKPKRDKNKKRKEGKGEGFKEGAAEAASPSSENTAAVSSTPTSNPDTTTAAKPKSLPQNWMETELDPRVPTYFLHQPRVSNHLPGMTLRWAGDGRDYIREKYNKPGKVKKSKKESYKKRDMKYAPAVCYINGDPVWRKWELQYTVLVPRPDDPALPRPPREPRFTWGKSWQGSTQRGLANGLSKEDTVFRGKHTKDKSEWIYKGLNERGVIDGRGLISTWYPFKRGKLAWRTVGETGKEWVKKEAERRKELRRKSTSDIGAEEHLLGQEGDDDNLVLLPPEKLPRHLWPIQLDPVPEPSQSPTCPPQPSQNTANQDPKKGPPNPSKVTMTWSNILSREYEFTYLNANFYWRGTKESNEYAPGEEHTESEGDLQKAITKKAVEVARKKKGFDLCIWAHLKLVVCLPKDVVDSWGDGGKSLGLLGEKRSMSARAKGDSSDDKVIVDEGGFGRMKRSNSFSSFWSGMTRRNTIADGEGVRSTFTDGNTDPKKSIICKGLDDDDAEQKKPYSEHDCGIPSALAPNKPLSRRPSLFQNILPSRPKTPSTPIITTTTDKSTPNPPTTSPRSSTWGTSTSTSTLVPWISRTFTNQSHTSTTSLLAKNNSNSKGKASSSSPSSSPSSTKDQGGEKVEVVIARYSCVFGALRKAGRLVVDEEALERVAGYIFGSGVGDEKGKGSESGRVRYINPPILPPPSPPHNTQQRQNEDKNETTNPLSQPQTPTYSSTPAHGPNPNLYNDPREKNKVEEKNEKERKNTLEEEEESISTQKERLRHLVIATGLCMIIGEKQKRDTIKEIILAAATEGGSV